MQLGAPPSTGSSQQFKPTGAWQTATAYLVNDLCTYLGASYVCITAHTSAAGNEPNVSTDWKLFLPSTTDDTVNEINPAGASQTPNFDNFKTHKIVLDQALSLTLAGTLGATTKLVGVLEIVKNGFAITPQNFSFPSGVVWSTTGGLVDRFVVEGRNIGGNDVWRVLQVDDNWDTAPAASLPANVFMQYLFDEGTGQTAADQSGNGYTLTLGADANAAADDPAWAATGLTFVRANAEYVQRAALSEISVGSDWTLSFLMKLANLTNDQTILNNNISAADRTVVMYRSTSDKFGADAADDVNNYKQAVIASNYDGLGATIDNTWIVFTVRYNSTTHTVDFLINNVVYAGVSGSSWNPSTPAGMIAGANVSLGRAADLELATMIGWTRVLTDTEVINSVYPYQKNIATARSIPGLP